MFLAKYPELEIPEYPVYAMYLRKSREDKEVAEGETLNRHRAQLNALAERMGIMVQEKYIFTEVVSGETLSARPELQKLLALMETGLIIGVLVVEDTRLTRGDKVDQGIIQNTFKYTNTKIITPNMEYDLFRDSDSSMLDLRLMFSNMELINTTRRLANGRKASVNEGKFVGQSAPWGYEKYKLEGQKGYSLKIKEDEAYYIRLIYDTFIKEGTYGAVIQKLADLGVYTSTGHRFQTPYIKWVLTNPTYKGYVSYSRRKTVKKMVDGNVVKKHEDNADYMCVKGLHEPIISEEVWETANRLIRERYVPKINKETVLVNSLAGILRCGKCGRVMSMTGSNGNRQNYIRCSYEKCDAISNRFDYVENAIIEQLESWLDGYMIELQQTPKPRAGHGKAVASAESELIKIKEQINRVSDLFERGVYDEERYSERNAVLVAKRNEISEKIESLKKEIESEKERDNSIDMLPKYQSIIEALKTETDIFAKNKMLKQLLVKVDYYKDPKTNEVRLKIFPRLPKY